MPAYFTDGEIIEAAIDGILSEVHVAMPALVLSYDNTTQTVGVQPLCQRVLFDENGNKSYEQLPTIPNVPVAFPRGGGFFITFPISVGDYVFLVFSEMSTSEVRSTGQNSKPLDTRRHSLSHPIAIPSYYPETKTLSAPTTQGNTILIGKEGATQDFASVASKVDAALTLIKTHTHTGVTTGAGASGTSAELAAMGTSSGSATVKVTQ